MFIGSYSCCAPNFGVQQPYHAAEVASQASTASGCWSCPPTGSSLRMLYKTSTYLEDWSCNVCAQSAHALPVLALHGYCFRIFYASLQPLCFLNPMASQALRWNRGHHRQTRFAGTLHVGWLFAMNVSRPVLKYQPSLTQTVLDSCFVP